MKDTVLVTGSQGFIGSYLCQHLLNKNYNVIGIDNFSKYGKVVRPQDKHPNFLLYEDDIRSIGPHDERFKEVNYIIAGAAMIGGITYFHKYAYDLLSHNEKVIANTFDLAVELKKRGTLKRIVVISSSMVFENTQVFPTPEAQIKECPPPFSTYGFQKLATEYFAKGAWEQYQVPYSIARPFNCVGVGEEEAIGEEQMEMGNMKMLMSHVLPDLVYKALHLRHNDRLPILGEGTQVRHYTNGWDVARGIELCMSHPNAHNEDFNISHSQATTVLDLADIVWKSIHGVSPLIEHLPAFEYDVPYRSPDTRKAKELLGFEATIDLETSVNEVVDWMRAKYEREDPEPNSEFSRGTFPL